MPTWRNLAPKLPVNRNESGKLWSRAASRTVIFEYQAATFGLADWHGVRIYVTTWDFDGIDARYRPLSEAGGQWSMGGGAETDPYIMDDAGPILIPAAE